MKKLLRIVVLGLLLSGCKPLPENFVGMDSSWIKSLTVLFFICAAIVGIFLIWFNKANKEKKVSDDDLSDFLGGISFLAGPGLFTAICYIVMVVSGFLLISFYIKTFLAIIVSIVALFGATALFLDKKK